MKFTKLLVGALCLAGLLEARSPVETYGRLSIKGKQLVDSTGAAVTLRGMSLFWHMHDGGKQYWTKGTLKWALTDWRASVIRAPMGVEDDASNGYKQLGYISNPEPALNAIRTIVDAAIEAGVYIVVDFHAHDKHTAEAKIFFQTIGQEYGNVPNIIWEIWNEPKDRSWSDISGYAKEVIPVIRKYSQGVILVPTGFYCQWTEGPNADLDSYPNLAYVIHFYAGEHSWRDRLTQSRPVFVSEWGTTNAQGDLGYSESGSTGWLTETDRLGISTCNWNLGNPQKGSVSSLHVEGSAALQTTADPGGNWTDADLTTSGKFIRTYLRSKNPAWTISDTTTKVVSPLKANKDSAVKAVDSVTFTAAFNKAVPWSITLTGRTSKGVATFGGASSLAAKGVWFAGKRGSGTTISFGADEWVDAVLQPGNSKTSVFLKAPLAVVRPTIRMANLQWKGDRLLVPSDAVPNGGRVQVRLLGADGKTIWRKTALVIDGEAEIGARPQYRSLQILEIESGNQILRTIAVPNF